MWYCYKCQQWVFNGTTHTCFQWYPGMYQTPIVPSPTWEQWERIVKALEKLAEK